MQNDADRSECFNPKPTGNCTRLKIVQHGNKIRIRRRKRDYRAFA